MSKRPRSVCDMPWSQNISSYQIWDTLQIQKLQICSGLDLARTETRGQGHSDLEPVGNSQGPKMYLHTKYGTATIKFNNIGDLLWVQFFKTWLLRSRSQWLKTVSRIPWPQHISTNWFLGVICHIVGDMLITLCFACCRWVVLSVNCFCLHTTIMLTVCYINRQLGRGYHYSDTNACGESAASKKSIERGSARKNYLKILSTDIFSCLFFAFLNCKYTVWPWSFWSDPNLLQVWLLTCITADNSAGNFDIQWRSRHIIEKKC